MIEHRIAVLTPNKQIPAQYDCRERTVAKGNQSRAERSSNREGTRSIPGRSAADIGKHGTHSEEASTVSLYPLHLKVVLQQENPELPFRYRCALDALSIPHCQSWLGASHSLALSHVGPTTCAKRLHPTDVSVGCTPLAIYRAVWALTYKLYARNCNSRASGCR